MNPGSAIKRRIEQALGRVVDRALPDPDARAALAGRRLAIHVLKPELDITLVFGHLGLRLEALPEEAPDLSLTGSIGDFRALAKGENPIGLKVAGDLGWARTVESIARELPHDRNGIIALLLEPSAASFANQGIDEVESVARDCALALRPRIIRTLTSLGLGVERRDSLHLGDAIDALTRAVHDLETRLAGQKGPEAS